MASDTNSNSSIVAIFAILMIVLLGGFFAWRMGVFGGGGRGDHTHKIDIDLKAK